MKKVMLVFLMGVLGCGAEPPTTDRPDAGAMPDAPTMPDAPIGDDRVAPPPDAVVTPDVPVMPDDVPPTGDAPAAAICRPSLEPVQTCAGMLCQPNPWNPTCAGASGCTCDLQASDMPETLCAPPGMMPACRAVAVSCSPGRNHCSVNLPEGVDYAEVPCLQANAEGRGGLRNTIGTGWRLETASSGQVRFSYPDEFIFSERGFFRICNGLPSEESGFPPEFAGRPFCAECAGMTCYWNRGALRNRAPSVEIGIGPLGCSLEFRYYLAGAATPEVVRRFNSLNTACN